jgi:hypothetical protein
MNMKLNKLAIGALSFGLLGLTSVQANFIPNQGTQGYTVIHLTGSTAFRGATFRAICNALGGEGSCNVASYNATALGSIPAGYVQEQTGKKMNIYGNLTGCGYVLVKCSWSGSEAGYIDVVNAAQTESFMADTEPLGDAGTPVIGTGNPTVATVTEASVDLAMADNSLTYSRSKGATLLGNRAVGVIPFVYAKNAQYAADQTVNPWMSVTNITHAQIRNLVKSGFIDAATLTGNSTDAGKYFYLAGRNYNSGTRVNHLLNAGLATTAAEKQITIAGSDGSPTFTGPSSANLAGQDSGGTLANTMSYRGSGPLGWWAVAYLGLPDAAGAALANAGGGPVFLSLSGVAESTAAIQQGQYTYWGTEYIGESSSANGCAQTLYTALTSAAFDASITANLEIGLGTMACTKSSDAADPVHN